MMNRFSLAHIWLPVYFALLALTLNNTIPYRGDESFYIASSIRMIKADDYLLPVYFGEPRFQKPILPYWITVAGYKLFGIHLWSGRILFALLSAITLLLLYRFAYALIPDQRFASLNALLLASSPLFVESARVSMTDMPLLFFTTLALFAFYQALERPERLPQYYLLAYAAMGLACSSKGVFGVFPGVAMFAYLLIVRSPNYRAALWRMLHPLPVAIFLLLAGWWYLYAYWFHAPELLRQLQTESEIATSHVWQIFGNLLAYSKDALLYYAPFSAIAVYLAVKRRVTLPPRFLPLLVYALATFALLVFALERHKSRYFLLTFPALTLLISYVFHRHQFYALAEKLAIGLSALQLMIYLVYPMISGQPINELVRYWDNHLNGTLALYEMPRRENSWAQALSHGKLQAYGKHGEYLIVEEKKLENFQRYEVIKTAKKLKNFKIHGFSLVKTDETYLLIRPFSAQFP